MFGVLGPLQVGPGTRTQSSYFQANEASGDITQPLGKLKEFFDNGLINQDEFKKKQEELLRLL